MSLLKLKLARDETVLDYSYLKYTCGKTIGGGDLRSLIVGKSARAILKLSPNDAIHRLGIESDEDKFLLAVEHEAVTAALGFLFGVETSVTPRYSINRIAEEVDYTEIDIDAAPLPTAPKIPLPCSSFPESPTPNIPEHS